MSIENIVIIYDEYFKTKQQQQEYNILFKQNCTEYNNINNDFIKNIQLQQNNNIAHTVIIENNIDIENNINLQNDLFIKKTYRKLSKVIHPDKRNENSHLFIKCKKSYDNKNISSLLYCAYKCNVNDIVIPKCVISTIESELKIIQQQIHNLKRTVSWQWYFGSNVEKHNILNIIKDI